MQEAAEQLTAEEHRLQSSAAEAGAQQREAADKLRRKRVECERLEQRLLQLKSVRAPYQDELDGLEAELGGLYGMYLDKFRTLEYLEGELEKRQRCVCI